MIELENLTVNFGGVVALDTISATFTTPVSGIIGPNGAGKTTTINLFLGFVAPTSGQALIAGLDVSAHDRETKQRIAYIPEQVMLYRNLTGLENLEYFAALAGKRPGAERLSAILVEAGLQGDAVDRKVAGYSKGMRQKVGIAIALAKEASVLLLDEPTSGLDPKASNEFSALLEHLRERQVAVLMATHDLFRAKETGTRVGIMRHGRLVAEMATSELGHSDLERVYLDHMRE